MIISRKYPRGARFTMSDVPTDVERDAVELIAQDGGLARGVVYRQRGTQPGVGALMLHPRMDQSQSYLLLPLAAAGYAAMGCAGRYTGNDSTAIQELLLLDIAEGVKAFRARGCEQVVLVGNSGGGALLTMYQAVARTPPADRWATTPAGDPCDLRAYDLPPADGLVLLGAHPGEGTRLAKWLDPSVTDEDDPLSLDPALDMYDPANGFRVPPEPSSYSPEFLERFRAAQRDRARRLDERAVARLAARRSAAEQAEAAPEGSIEKRRFLRRSLLQDHMLIHRVLAYPEWLDTSLEPDDRDVGGFNNDPRPDLQNWETSIATFLLPEAFLSTWSAATSRADIHQLLPAIADPLLVVHYGGDAATRISEVRRYIDVSAATDKELVIIPKVDHWGFPIIGPHRRGPRTSAGTDAMVSWMRQRFPL